MGQKYVFWRVVHFTEDTLNNSQTLLRKMQWFGRNCLSQQTQQQHELGEDVFGQGREQKHEWY